MSCINRAKRIANAIRLYSARYDGWTNPDPDYYVKLAKYKLKDESGYDPAFAARVKDFICPADGAPEPNSHGYRSSYVVVGPDRGQNFQRLSAEAAQVPLVVEKGKRHPVAGKLVANYVFADLHASTGGPPVYMSGARARAWYGSTSSWSKLQADNMDNKPDYESIWTRELSADRNVFRATLPVSRRAYKRPVDRKPA